MQVIVEKLDKNFGEQAVLRDISVEVQDQELFFLLGPSGCGKTTLLRLIAGFYQPDQGQIRFGDRLMNDVPPHQRNTGMVFQNYALWPHLSVADNVAYGLEVRRIHAAECKSRVAEALGTVQMEAYSARMPNQLSGGQQQRVALARALVIKPDVLLLDEPLSNLDARLRLELREEIRRIHRQTKITTIYVTHDQKEALSLADRIAILHQGRIEQVGTPRSIYRSPSSPFVADFVGEINWLEAVVFNVDGAETRVRAQSVELAVRSDVRLSPGDHVRIGFRPEAVNIGPADRNLLATVIREVSYLGETEEYRLELEGQWLIKAVERNPSTTRRIGDRLAAHIRPEDLLIFPASSRG